MTWTALFCPPSFVCWMSHSSCGIAHVLSLAAAFSTCHLVCLSWPVLPVIWARAGTESAPCFGWNCSGSHCMEKHAALRLITECCFCQPDPSIIKFHLSLSLNGFLSYWWWLPRSIILLGVSKWWHPNFITPSIFIKCCLGSNVCLSWNIFPIGDLR